MILPAVLGLAFQALLKILPSTLHTAKPLVLLRSAPSAAVCTPLEILQGPDLAASARDENIKLMVLSTPKAGATLAKRLMLARNNLTTEAVRYGGYPLKYAGLVFDKQPGRAPPNSLASVRPCATDPDWHCIQLVRNPLDRAISSYIHTLITGLSPAFAELSDACGRDVPDGYCQRNASFFEFARALTARARTRTRSKGDIHFMPQVRRGQGEMQGLLSVPVEMMSEVDAVDCSPLAALQLENFTKAEEAAGLKKLQHYKVHTQETTTGSEHLPFEHVRDAVWSHTTPRYDSFWGDQALCREVVGCLYGADLDLYIQTCTDEASPLQQCAAFQRVCSRELARLREVCGLPLDNTDRRSDGAAPQKL